MSRRRTRRLLWDVVGLAVFAVMVFPVYWMVATAFKPGIDIESYTPRWIPLHPTLVHFADAIHHNPSSHIFWTDARNSLVVVATVTVLSMVLAFLAAVALAKFRFVGRKAFIVSMIVIQMLPANALIIPLYVVLARYHQTGQLTGVIVTYMTFVLPFSVWMLRGFIIGIPQELEEAAQVDGSTRVGAFVRILLPLVAPGLVATSVYAFIQAWNEFIFAYILLSDAEKQTLTVWLAGFYGTAHGTDWGGLMAASTLTAIPVVVFFVLIQRKIAFGLTAGAVKA